MNYRKAVALGLISFSILGGMMASPIAGAVITNAAEVVQATPPSTVNINVHKLMYDKYLNFDVAKNGISNDGHEHSLPDGISAYSKAKYGDIEFTIYDITASFKGSYTDKTINTIVSDVEKNGSASSYLKDTLSKKAAVDNSGNIVFKDMEAYKSGNRFAYIIVETKSPKGFTNQKAKPSVVITPMTTSDGKNFFKDINVYPKNIMQDLEFTLTKNKEDGTPLAGAKFDLYKGEPGKGTKLTSSSVVADAQGHIKATGLTVGKYYWVESPSTNVVGDTTTDGNSEAGKYLLGADAKNDANNKLTFEITADGIDQSSLVGSFINYLPPTADKKVTNGTDGFDVGAEAHYVGTVHIPKDVNGSKGISMVGNEQTTSNYTVLNWKDIPTTGLKYIESKGDVVVKDSKGNALSKGTDYTLSKITQDGVDGFVVDFLDVNSKPTAKVATLAGTDVTIEYDMTITQEAKIQSDIDNGYTLSYKNGGSGETKEITGKVPVQTYGAKFLKESSGVFGSGVAATPLADAQFVLKNAEGKFYGGKIDGDKDGVTEVNWVDSQAKAEILKSGKDGLFEIAGLHLGDYSLEEVVAPNGYQKLNEPVKFKVTKDSYNTAKTIKIENDAKSVIPRTGSNEMIVILATSASVLTVGAFALLKKSRKNA